MPGSFFLFLVDGGGPLPQINTGPLLPRPRGNYEVILVALKGYRRNIHSI